jgi:hypothetical protein
VFVRRELPLVAVRATQESVGARVTFTWMTLRDRNEGVEERKEWAKEEIRHLQTITGPHFGRMSAQKGLPGLSTGSKWRAPAAYTSA